jgi:hypothetical protein
MSLILNKLAPEGIDEKIRLNEIAPGIDIYQLRDAIKQELSDCTWHIIRSTVQQQFYREQLEHIDSRIKHFEATGEKAWELPAPAPAADGEQKKEG